MPPRHWASLIPHGIGQQKPFHYLEMARVAWENRDQLPFAWRILRDGVCDGCALGTSGLRDWTLDGVHLCMVRLELLRLNTAPAIDASRLDDVARLRELDSRRLRELGRLAEPCVRRPGEPGFRRVGWNEALDRIAEGLRQTDPERVAFYLTSRGITNEVYYAAQKAARFLGTNHVDNSARMCHAASTVAMRATLGHGASTCSYVDWLEADLIVFFGSNTPNNQPVTTKYLHHAKKRGAEVAVVNPYREPGLERYWVPSIAESAVFGTRIADHWFDVHTGGDLAFLVGVLRALDESGSSDRSFVEQRTSHFDEAVAAARATPWDAIESRSGAPRDRVESFARLLAARPKAIFVWSMGLTQHAHGVETVRALVNVALARGLVGRRGCGLMPIRGHSGVQGGAEVGCAPGVDAEAAARWRDVWGFDLPGTPGLAAADMLDAAAGGRLDAFWMVGGNFLETVADRSHVTRALARPRLRIHQDIVLSTAMLVEPSAEVWILPAATRYESPGGGTETSTERRIIFSPEIPGRRVGEARPEWQVLTEVMARVDPSRAELIRVEDAASLRGEIARAVPLYAGIEGLSRKGDEVQWGGRQLFAEGDFPTPDGRAQFSVVTLPATDIEPGRFRLSTRRGKQFNSMVQRDRDPLTGARRDEVLIAAADAERLGLVAGARVRLRSRHGSYECRVRLAAIHPGNVEVHWPEGMVLLDGHLRDPASRAPDYNTDIAIERWDGVRYRPG
jgi:molybdopterin-dependent oxidoreductase alpha subunit